jgi:hypothetical protein
LLGEALGGRLVTGEGAIDMDFVGFGEAVGRAEVGARVVGRCLGSTGEDANEPVYGRGLAATMMDVDHGPTRRAGGPPARRRDRGGQPQGRERAAEGR